ncbi:16100_t:CDS:2 [Funneliformis caledonium]|uniref:16100_t:CDS:1 n=1 Tax=Funneliformis caledonium TaxID=1117310 RepID=A0A9N8WJ94_9GLOM|nr:16100_t:CDS:2 [Funneliformis caledonium]
MVSPAYAEPVEIRRGKKINSPNRNGAQDIGLSPSSFNRQNNINRLAASPPLAQSYSQLSKSQPYSGQNALDSHLSSSGKFPVTDSSGSFNQTPETFAIDIPKQRQAEIVKKHLVTEDDLAGNSEHYGSSGNNHALYSTSHKLPGGDATHEVYKWHAEIENAPMKRTRSHSLHLPRPTDPDTSNIREPGGFRRHHVIMKARQAGKEPPNIITRNFIDFLTMYGHFAEATPLIPRERATEGGTATPSKAVFLLLKSFVGTGVMFLPKAFCNGGMVFSSVVLVFIGLISLVSFLLLVQTRLHVPYGFGGIGGVLYGNWMRLAVLFSITISQIGFVCAYMIFVAKNLKSVAEQVMGIRTDLYMYIIGQLFVFVPLAMIRRISRLSFTALIADAFIMFGLLYLYYFDISKLVKDGVSDIKPFNPEDFALFIGTAVFTFEGIGLIIPITESMKEPERFPGVLTGVMVFITVLFTSMGALSYATFGSAIETVVIINLPSDDPIVQTVQFLYALAILLSIPLQLFPAIRIMEQGLFEKSGKHDPYVKWQKNIFRFLTVVACALISWGGASDLDKFVSLIGSFACVPLCFLYPPLFHYKAAARSFGAKSLDVFIFMFGVFSLFYTTYITIRKWGENE